jgi:predicted DsbA family dithiol-disulfide isomerase
VLALGQKLKIQGTPAIFFADGTRIPGAVDLKTLEAKLERSSNKQRLQYRVSIAAGSSLRRCRI